jgi:hypothetical protein
MNWNQLALPKPILTTFTRYDPAGRFREIPGVWNRCNDNATCAIYQWLIRQTNLSPQQ